MTKKEFTDAVIAKSGVTITKADAQKIVDAVVAVTALPVPDDSILLIYCVADVKNVVPFVTVNAPFASAVTAVTALPEPVVVAVVIWSVNFAFDGTSTATVFPFTVAASPVHTTECQLSYQFWILPNARAKSCAVGLPLILDAWSLPPDTVTSDVAFVNVTLIFTSLNVLFAIISTP